MPSFSITEICLESMIWFKKSVRKEIRSLPPNLKCSLVRPKESMALLFFSFLSALHTSFSVMILTGCLSVSQIEVIFSISESTCALYSTEKETSLVVWQVSENG